MSQQLSIHSPAPAVRMYRGWYWLLLVLSTLAVSGCSLNPWYEPPIVNTRVVYFSNAENANLNQSIAFDLVIIYDKELVEKFAELPASTWFEQREQFKRDHPSKLFSWEWELTPGRDVPMFKLEGTEDAQALFAFANYSTEGPHRARLDPFVVVRIDLQERKFDIRPVLN